MIQTIEGRIGGGKTYTAMGWIGNHLSKGGVVATNINIQLDDFKDQYGKKRGLRWFLKREFGYTLHDSQIIRLSDTKMVDYLTKKGTVELNEIVMFYKLVPRGTPKKPVLVVIDEAHIHFPQDGYKSLPRELLHFLTLSRHACVDVVFISQHIKNMWCQMLRLAQFRWAIRDMKRYGLPFGVFNLPWLFPHFLQQKNDYDGKTVMSRKFEWHRKRLYETYKSPELASAFESRPLAESVEVEKKVLTMKDRLALVGIGVAAGIAIMVVPACVNKGVSDESTIAVAVENGNIALEETARSVEAAGTTIQGFEEETEYYIGHLDSGWDSKFFTTDRTYMIGDLYDGLPVVKVSDRVLVTFDMATGDYFKTRFKIDSRN